MSLKHIVSVIAIGAVGLLIWKYKCNESQVGGGKKHRARRPNAVIIPLPEVVYCGRRNR